MKRFLFLTSTLGGWNSGITFNAPGESGGAGAGAGGDSANQTNQSQGQADQNIDPITGNPIQQQVDDFDDVLNVFAETETEKLERQKREDQARQAAQNKAQNPDTVSKSIMQQITDSVNSFSVDEKVFENVDMSDPAAVRGVLTQVARDSMLRSVALAMNPVQVAMKQLEDKMTRMISEQATYTVSRNSDSERLRREVPQLDDPKLGPLLRQMDETLNGKPVADRIRTLKGFLAKAGLGESNTQQSQQAAVSPASSLDFMFGKI